jgi:nucleoside-diphosphate kinase
MQKTFGIIKPEGVANGKDRFITQMIESEGLKIIRSETKTLDRSKLEQHYAKDDDWFNNVGANVLKTFTDYELSPSKEIGTTKKLEAGKLMLKWVIDHMSSGPVVILEIEGENAVEEFRKLCGISSDPSKCEPNTIRAMLSNDNNTKAILEQRTMYNYLHSSGTAEESAAEIKLWFGN